MTRTRDDKSELIRAFPRKIRLLRRDQFLVKTISQPVINCILGGFVLSRRGTIFRCLLNLSLAMTNPEHNSPQFSAKNMSLGDTPNLSRRGFLRALSALGVMAGVDGVLSPQRLEAAESSRSINWKEILGRFGDSVLIAGERDESGKDMIVGRTMNEIYQLYLQQQKDWCAVDAAYCEGEVAHARRDNRVLVPNDYMLSVPIPRAGQSVTSMNADEIPSIYLPVGRYDNQKNAGEFARYASDILGLNAENTPICRWWTRMASRARCY